MGGWVGQAEESRLPSPPPPSQGNRKPWWTLRTLSLHSCVYHDFCAGEWPDWAPTWSCRDHHEGWDSHAGVWGCGERAAVALGGGAEWDVCSHAPLGGRGMPLYISMHLCSI